jgi:hypothetical protein
MKPAQRVALCTLSLVVMHLGLVAQNAFANDGGIALGGNPRLLNSHPSVQMTSEHIRLTVEDRQVRVDCDFVFTNHGSGCVVRMGFPDVGIGAHDPDEETEIPMAQPPHTTFTSFRSYVDGRLVTTKLIRADTEGHYWHTKSVRFPAHSVVHIRDVYTQRVGGGITEDGKGSAEQVGYIVHTGASWHGPIGHTQIDVTFHCSQIHGTPVPVAVTNVARNGDGRALIRPVSSSDTVVWKGPCVPTVQGNTLRFVRTNWRPTTNDDLELTYGYR